MLAALNDSSPFTCEQVSRALGEHLISESLTVNEFGESIGWEVSDLLEDPQNWHEQPVELRYLVCSRLSIDWVGALGG